MHSNCNFLLQRIEGIEKITIVDNTSQSPLQDGESYNYSVAEKRQIILKFVVKSKSYDEYLMLRNEVIKCFNPKVSGKLTYENGSILRELKCKSEETPDMPIDRKNKMVECTVILIAYDPYLQNINFNNIEITAWEGGFTFPLSLPFSLKQKGEPRVNIFCDGHVETPVEIIFHGPAENPTVTNLTTGDFIKINRTLTSDETLYIDTTFGKKTVEVEANGARQNAFNYIDLNSSFFNLQPGDNLIEYTAGGEVTPQGVEIRYKNRYLGV